MKSLVEYTKKELLARQKALTAIYEDYCAKGLKLDMSRGKPGAEQLELTVGLLTNFHPDSCFRSESGTDVRNYGLMEGIPEARRLFGEMLDVPSDSVIVGGNSSLNMMFDYIATAYSHGVCGNTPWSRLEQVKWLCPVPGYDRHFAITEYFGAQMINVPMTEQGPDMDVVEQLVKDPAVKGIWCVPMYSNPDGITYSDETVRRLAAMTTAAPDFRVLWDNAYGIHHIYDTHDHLLNFYEACRAAGHEDRCILFCSTSKISFPGAGVAALAASPANLADIRRRLKIQTIGYDKINMWRHVLFFRDLNGMVEHMKLHTAVLRPKFDAVLGALEKNLGGRGVARWHKPNGGYFISVFLMDGCAKRTVALLKEAGVTMTDAGATYPYHRDPADSNLRIAPTFPSLAELQVAADLFCVAAEMAAIEVLLKK